jgi:hypothetical protein
MSALQAEDWPSVPTEDAVLADRVRRIIDTAASAYADGLTRGPVKTRKERREDAIRHGTDAILALIKAQP